MNALLLGRLAAVRGRYLALSSEQFGNVAVLLGLHPMMVPAFRLLLAPSRRRSVTVPEVVGVHWMSVGLPAVREKPWGTLKGLGPLAVCATIAVEKATMARSIERILTEGASALGFYYEVYDYLFDMIKDYRKMIHI